MAAILRLYWLRNVSRLIGERDQVGSNWGEGRVSAEAEHVLRLT